MTSLYTDDAELYDIAFAWDISDEVRWLFERLGRPRSVLEPGCGSGRMLEAFARLGVDVAGIDISPRMIELAHERIGDKANLRIADMTDFDLGRRFDAAISPINTLLHLTPDELARHLECMTRQLEADGVVQVGLVKPEDEPFPGSHWEEPACFSSRATRRASFEVCFACGLSCSHTTSSAQAKEE